MKNIIKRILKQSDFDWLDDIPSYFELIEPISINNPKNTIRLHITNLYNNDVWANNWINFENKNTSLEVLVRIVKILKNGINRNGELDIDLLVDLYFNGGHDYIVDNWMLSRLEELPPKTDEDYESVLEINKYDLRDMLINDLIEIGVINSDDRGEFASIEKWWVTYFDDFGVEYKAKMTI